MTDLGSVPDRVDISCSLQEADPFDTDHRRHRGVVLTSRFAPRSLTLFRPDAEAVTS